jgi:hypothetical protein
MDAWDIAEALVFGRRIPPAKLRFVSQHGDGADQVYVLLYQVIAERRPLREVIKAIRAICPHQPTAEAWVQITRYASDPTGRSFVKLAAAVAKGDRSAETIIRLSPLVLTGPHRRKFASLIASMHQRGVTIGADIHDLSFELRCLVGPSRLRAK